MRRYELSAEADADFAGLYRFGLARFGFNAATDYAYSFLSFFETLAAFPEAYIEVPDIAAGLRRAVHRSHAVYFEIMPNGDVRILRILGRQDAHGLFDA